MISLRLKNQKPKYKKFILSLSFGNYLKGDGGTDKVIAEHQKLYNQHQLSYIQIAPVGKNSDHSNKTFYTVIVDGCYCGILSENNLLYWLSQLTASQYFLDTVFIHHLLKFRPQFVRHICDSTEAPIIFYLHDYYSICTSYTLINSRGYYCGDEKVSAEKCAGCSYYKSAEPHLDEVLNLLLSIQNRLTVVSPSEATLAIWEKTFSEVNCRKRVIPHQIPVGLLQKEKKAVNSGDPIKIAFIGKLVPIKGSQMWDSFVKSTAEHSGVYDCYYFGVSDNPYAYVTKVNVFVTPENPNAMVKALQEHHIQVAVLWSICPETYSYAYFEAMTAGCYIITGKDSGNIAAQVRKNRNGIVFDSAEEALEYLNNTDRFMKDLTDFFPSVPDHFETNSNILTLLSDANFIIMNDTERNFCSSVEEIILDILYRIKYSKHMKK